MGRSTAGLPRGGSDVSDVSSPVALQARSLYRFFRSGDEETLALRDVSLTVGAGELVVVTGPSGSGKSTLLRCLAGLDEPDGGTVLLAGRRLSHRSEAERAAVRARTIGVLLQSGNLLDALSVAGNIALCQSLVRRRPVHTPAELIAEVHLQHRAHAYPGQLSGGEAVRAGMTVAWANDPMLLLADEPTAELDTATEARVLELLQARARDGLAVLVASHSPGVAAAATRVLQLRDGRVAA